MSRRIVWCSAAIVWVLFWLLAPYLGPRAIVESGRAPALEDTAVQPLTSYFTDLAGQFSTLDTDRFTRTLEAFERETSNQVAVAIYADAPVGSIEAFTIRTATRSRLGHRGLDNGVILFVFPAARAARVEVGYGLEAVLTDGRAGEVLDRAFVPAWQRGDRTEAIDATITALCGAIRDAYRAGKMPGTLRVLARRFATGLPRVAREQWSAIRDEDLKSRMSMAVFFGVLGAVFLGGLLNAAQIVRNVVVGARNVREGRSVGRGMKRVDLEPLSDSFKLLTMFAGLLIIVAGTVIVAGGGAFGGGGALRHW